MSEVNFKLSASLLGHTLDVRAIAVTHDGYIVSASRDKTVKIWGPLEDGSGYHLVNTLTGHTNFVSSVCTLSPSQVHPQGLIVTGSNDKTISVYHPTHSSRFQLLKKHTETVCKLSRGINPDTFLSSSWDQTARLWTLHAEPTEAESVVFKGHTAAVWGVVQLLNGVVVTVSADKTVRTWRDDGSCLNTLTGHADCVRDVCVVGLDEFLTCSNDASVRHWSCNSLSCLHTFYGHANFVYSINTFSPNSSSGGFVTSSEDRTAKVWSTSGECVSTITHPATTVWSACALENGDVVTASCDGVVRIFSADPKRQADPETLKVFETEVLANSVDEREIGGVKVSQLPGKEALYEPGRSDGQTKLIREDNNTVVAYSWLSSEGRWDRLGDVMGAATDGAREGNRPTYNGKEYDYVFSVDIEEGRPPLKLPYNRSEDAWSAAQVFIHNNDLPQSYLEQVANFILTNSGQNQPNLTGDSTYMDPFTGGARYVPQTAATNNTTSNNSNTQSTSPQSNFFPQRDFLRFDQANPVMILDKLLEFDKQLSVKEDGVTALEDLVSVSDLGARCTAKHIETLYRLLDWPKDNLFPVLDVMRLLIRNQDPNSFLCQPSLIPLLKKIMGSSTVNNMLVIRVLCNMMNQDAGVQLTDKMRIDILNFVRDLNGQLTKPLQIAVATLILNLAVIITRSEIPGGRQEILDMADRKLLELTEEEAVFRTLVAVGTIVHNDSNTVYSQSLKDVVLLNSANVAFTERVHSCCRDILQFIL